MKFSTYDQDNDVHKTRNCAAFLGGGWWFYACSSSNLNGPYRGAVNGEGIFWRYFASKLKKADMKIRPILN